MDLPALFSRFPIHTNTPVPVPTRFLVIQPTLWIAPPRDTDALLSTDVECLKWQAYLALRGITHIALRWDISPEGALDARLPNLHLPDSSPHLLPPRSIPAWADTRLGHVPDPLDGYRDQTAKDESHAWIALLEGVVHAVLSLSQPVPHPGTLLRSDSRKTRALDTVLNPPPAPSTGFTSPFPPFGVNVDTSAVHARYAEAIAALSDRLATEKWFLGSQQPTALDALVFAYLHTLLHSSDSTRIQIARRPNLVAWERSVRSQVQAAFCLAPTAS
ncbi:hypothetical protein JVT61DRAFT_2205 [Boletus reticuloceps]|uniref:Metaxin glutathione S-transferase domain-containing protein n=1 Tax=Boletus reticuloceps TaxID=495285 RepID=A0A8I2YQK7_9AGAM|nr:hypothetical protein JVT61DRAFT_2205 [Boletus reticuloceps]